MELPLRALAAHRLCAYAAALLVLVLCAIGEFGSIGGATAVPWWADSGWTLCAAAAVGGCLTAARRDRSSWRAWLFIAAGCASWLGGQLVWDYSQLVARLTLPFPSLGDLGYLGLAPLSVIGIMALPRAPEQRKTTFKGLSLLDALIVACSLALIGVVATQGVFQSSTSLPLVGKAAALAYPAFYLTTGFVLFLFILRSPSIVVTRSMALLFVGLACEELGFVCYVPLVVGGAYRDGTPVDIVWMAGLLLIALSSREWRGPRGERSTLTTNAFTLILTTMELVPMILGVAAAFVAPNLTHGPIRRPLEAGAFVLVSFVALRQVLQAVDHVRLYRTEIAQRDLAQRRAERLRRVQEHGRALHLDLDPAAIGRLTVDTARAALGFRIVVLNLVTDPGAPLDAQRVKPVAEAGLAPEVSTAFLDHDAPASDILVLFREDFRLSRSYFLPAESASAVFENTSIPREIPSLAPAVEGGWRPGDELLVPLTARRTNDFLGFISVDDPIDGRRPDAEVVEMLEIFADQAALAIENGRLYERAQTLAMRDPVTGLANHRVVHQTLDAALAAMPDDAEEPEEREVALLLLDVDNFKLFNDTYGHPTGDAVLHAVAHHVRACLRESDLAARYGGDEFAIVLQGVSRAQAEDVARRIAAAVIAEPYVDDRGAIIPLTVSIGTAVAPADGRTRQALVAVADARMYATKSGAATDSVLIRSAADLLGETAFGVLEGLVAAVDAKDRYTREHSLDVTRYALMLADALDLPDEDRRTLAIAGPLHDVGKIAIPDRVLRKPGGLSDEEYAVVKSHVRYGVAIVRGLLDDARVIDTIAQHHERYDGRGYPYGLSGAETPLPGRIMQIADAVSAMTLDRPYRRGLSVERVIAELRRGAGAQFDPTLVEPFIAALRRSCIDDGPSDGRLVLRAS